MQIDWELLAKEQPVLGTIPGELRDVARMRGFDRGQRLYRQGQPPEEMLCVIRGEIRLVRYAPEGSEIILQRSRCGFIAEASLDAPAYHCDVVAASDGQLLLFPRCTFKGALAEDAAFNEAWIRLLGQEVRRLRAQSERLNLNSAADRICHYIEAEGSGGVVTLKQTRKSWAAELGLSHEVLYRTLRQLRESGDIMIDGERIGFSSPACR